VHPDVTEVVTEPGFHIGADIGGERLATGRYDVVHGRRGGLSNVLRGYLLPFGEHARRA
jgi:hypothetical protein